MAAAGDTSTRFDSSAGELSSPPSGSLSEPTSPSRQSNRRRTTDKYIKPHMEEIVVGSERRRSEGQPQQPQSQSQSQSQQQRSFQQYQPPPPNDNTSINGRPQPQKRYQLIDGEWVQLTAAGVPRKKPGRKPGSVVKPKTTTPTGDGSDQTKARKPRKSRDPDAPPIQRKRKLAPASDAETEVSGSRPLAPAGSGTASPSPSMQPLLGESLAQRHQPHHAEQRYSPKMPKREGYPGSMQSILNADPPQASPPNHTGSTAIPVRTSGQSYDPIRGNYDPVRETMTSHSHNHYSSTSGSPRGLAATQATHRSPSIASLIEPQASTKASPSHAYQHTLSQPRLQHQEASSMPPSPSYAPKPVSTPTQTPQHISQETVKEVPPPAPPVQRPVINQANFTTIANGPVKRVSPKQKPTAGASTPKTDNLDDIPHEGEERSILDFGKARPGEEAETPTIVLTIPITSGETNKYVNFMRMAEDRYGWDALHPRLAANRDRKARIAAAAASLEKTESGRESGDEMSVDLSDGEGSNPENGGTSGADAQAKPKKKRNFKEDQYDVHDDFVDDSELLWEAQAAASRDGFFVYSGPLVPEVEKPAAGQDGPPKRGRGGRGSRGGGRGASTRGGAGSGRGGGPGSRGGSITRKPRITKSEKAQREREKAEREQLAKTAANGYVLQPTTPSFSVRELGA